MLMRPHPLPLLQAPAPRTPPLQPYDRHLMAKHSSVYPTSEELEAVQVIISHVECALKAVSDTLDEKPAAEETPEAERYRPTARGPRR